MRWSSASRIRLRRSTRCQPQRTEIRDPRRRPHLERQRRPAPRARASPASRRPRTPTRVEPAAVVTHDELDRRHRRRQRKLRPTRVRMPDHIRQGLLRDAIDHELLVGLERGKPGRDRAARPAAGSGASRHWSAPRAPRQPEIVERLRPQPPRDPAHLLQARTHRLASLARRRPHARVGAASARSSWRTTAVSAWPDLVVQLARDPRRLLLLRRQRTPRAVAPLTSRRPSMSLKAAVSSATSGRPRRPSPAARAKRIDARITVVSRPSGRNVRLNSARFRTSMATRPPPRATSSTSAIGKLTVSGDTTSTSVASTSTAALVPNTRHSSVMWRGVAASGDE